MAKRQQHLFADLLPPLATAELAALKADIKAHGVRVPVDVDEDGNFLRRLALPKPVRHGSLTTLREKLIKIGAKVTRHSKYVSFQLAEVAVTRNSFAAILARIARLAIPPPVSAGCNA